LGDRLACLAARPAGTKLMFWKKRPIAAWAA
jgi:hypothetical protein